MIYGTQITIVTGAYKRTNITGGPHIVVNFKRGLITLMQINQWLGVSHQGVSAKVFRSPP